MEPLMLDYYVHGSFLPLLSPRIIHRRMTRIKELGKNRVYAALCNQGNCELVMGKWGKRRKGEKKNQEPGRLFFAHCKINVGICQAPSSAKETFFKRTTMRHGCMVICPGKISLIPPSPLLIQPLNIVAVANRIEAMIFYTEYPSVRNSGLLSLRAQSQCPRQYST